MHLEVSARHPQVIVSRSVVPAILAVCLLPALLIWSGLDLGTNDPNASVPPRTQVAQLQAERLLTIQTFLNALLEGGAAGCAFVVLFLALAHFRFEQNLAMPVWGLALCSSGVVDIFHALSEDGLLTAAQEHPFLVDWSWLAGRVFNASALLAAAILLWPRKIPRSEHEGRLVVTVFALVLGLAACLTILSALALSEQLPQSVFPNAVLKRPWELIPLGIFLAVGAVTRAGIARFKRSYLTQTIWLSIFPLGAVQLHMAFGSGAAFDSHFNAAHLLKLIGYALPLAGIVLDFGRAHQALRRAHDELALEAEQRRRAEAQQRDQEALYRSLVESLPLNVFRKDLDGRFVFANTRFCQTIGVTIEQLLGKSDADWFPAPLAEKYRRDDMRVISAEAPLEEVEEHRTPDGKKVFVQVLKAPVHDAAGHVVGIQGMFWDVSPRKLAEEALRESETRKRAIFEAALDAIVTVDKDGKIVEFNPAAEKTFGYLRGEVIGSEAAALFLRQGDRGRHRDNLSRYATSREAGSLLGQRNEQVAIRKNGEEFLAEFAMQPISLDGEAAVTMFVRDITERKKVEDKLRRSDNRFRRLVDANIIGIMITDFTGKVAEANDAFLDLVGYTRRDLMAGEIWWDKMTPPEFRHLDEWAIRQLEETDVCEAWEKEYLRKDGERVPVLVGVTLLDRATQGCLCWVVDMRSQKQAEAALRAAKDAADTANRAKSVFLANMSHEIRTPMNAILGMTDLVLDSALSGQQRQYLTIVQESAESLLSLLNDILDFSKIEAGKLALEAVEFRLRDAIAGALKSLAMPAHKKGLELIADIRPDVPDRVIGDPVRLRQVLVNLVGNATKFTEQGEIIVRVEQQSRHENDLLLQIAVIDTGVGIPQEKQALLFQAFEQLDSSTARRFGGTGLGLAISARLVELMGGNIRLESEVGRGASFLFTIHLEAAEVEGQSDDIDCYGLRDVPVLVVDDNHASRRAIEDLLRAWEMRPVGTADGPAALAALRASAASATPFALALIDAGMPRMDGFSLVERLRAELPGHAERLIMLLSSGDRSGDVARCEKLAVSAYLMKPINQSELFDTVVALLDRGKPGVVEEDELPAPPERPLRVLLVEDSPFNQQLAVGLLERRGHRVTVADNGRIGVDFHRAGNFDLVLMDVQMPELDGLEATRSIRAREQTTGGHVPIMAMTAQAMQGDRERCLDCGMDAYLVKPVRAKQLFAAIERLMQEHPPPEPESMPPAVVPIHAAFDVANALDAVGGDDDLLRQIINAFREECPDLVSGLRSAVEESIPGDVKRLAHRLKGAIRTFGADVASGHAQHLEELGRLGDLTGAAATLSALEVEVDLLLRELEDYLLPT